MRRLIFTLLLLSYALGRGEDAVSPQIPIVHTWGDLLKTKLIVVQSDLAISPDGKPIDPGASKPLSVQVGIDRDHTSAYGSVILYCLVQGVSFTRDSDACLGPFWINVHRAGDIEGGYFSAPAEQIPTFDKSSYLLFTRSIPLHEPGKYHINLQLATKARQPPKSVAEINVIAGGDPNQPWVPWGNSQLDIPPSKSQPENNSPPTYCTMSVSNPADGIAIPRTCALIVGDHVPDAEVTLPQLIPDQPDPGTHLKLEGNQLIVTTGLPFRSIPFVSPYIDYWFVARWWINDKPFMPRPHIDAPGDTTVRTFDGQVQDFKEAHFNLDFQPEAFGAKKGDKIGIQILFCPLGWQLCGEGSFMPMSQPAGTPYSASFSFPSNRIDFIYSGDPKNLQGK